MLNFLKMVLSGIVIFVCSILTAMAGVAMIFALVWVAFGALWVGFLSILVTIFINLIAKMKK